jgi:predicted kinase
MATLHLIHGFVGAGKTTFSKKLEKEANAIRFTLDEWVAVLYGSNPQQMEFQECENRVKTLIWNLAERALELGNDVILDFGFWKRSGRDEARERARRCGASVKLYDVRCPMEVIKARVLKRTAELPEGALYIDENAIAEFERRFEPLDPGENGIPIVTSE